MTGPKDSGRVGLVDEPHVRNCHDKVVGQQAVESVGVAAQVSFVPHTFKPSKFGNVGRLSRVELLRRSRDSARAWYYNHCNCNQKSSHEFSLESATTKPNQLIGALLRW